MATLLSDFQERLIEAIIDDMAKGKSKGLTRLSCLLHVMREFDRHIDDITQRRDLVRLWAMASEQVEKAIAELQAEQAKRKA